MEERCQRLLQQLGLASNPALARRKCPAANDANGGAGIQEGDIGRSVSYDDLYPSPSSSSSSATAGAFVIERSRSDGSVDPGSGYNQQQLQRQHLFCHLRSIHLPVSSKAAFIGRTRPASAGNLEIFDKMSRSLRRAAGLVAGKEPALGPQVG